jgi:alpha-tubulin suppressor-like RCC1 family protein
LGALTTWSSIIGYTHVIALKTDGTLWGWGKNNSGQLGLNNTTYYSSPKQIGALTTWSKLPTGINGSSTIIPA